MLWTLNLCHAVPCSKLRFYWDWIVILVVLVAAIYIPARVAFQWNRMDEVFLGTNSYRRGANMAGRAIFDTFMLLDVLFNLNCGYIREHDYVRTISPVPSLGTRLVCPDVCAWSLHGATCPYALAGLLAADAAPLRASGRS